eukprot:TRINITY_DN6049_c0_g1_i2.p1 TRINITY_DN6049_c0_g1~~TRINITY_DN6049_c0_g1_i2.p1  ORF type:complete len:616 (+),score=208.87 TRINITY_DN6049_c0_g1_i2:88-1848(+)
MKEEILLPPGGSPGILRRVLESPSGPSSVLENDENSSPREGSLSSSSSAERREDCRVQVETSSSPCGANLPSSISSFYEEDSPSSPAGVKTRLKTYSFRRSTRSSPLGTHNASKPYTPPPKSRLALFSSGSSPERSSSKKKPLAAHRVGFPNIYQTCYLNAILQCLLSQPSFVQSLLDLKAKASGRIPALLRSFCSLAEAKEEGNQGLVSKEILKLKNILSNLDSTFKGSSMQDADEFLLKFCDTLREQCKSLQEPDPITENIEHEMETVITCSSCHSKNSTSSKHLICTLNSPISSAGSNEKRNSLGGLLGKTFSPSVIEPWSCEHCGLTNGSATLSSFFKSLPRVLILHVPRSNYDSHSDVKNQKIKLAINFFEHLNLSSVTIGERVAFPDKKAFIISRNGVSSRSNGVDEDDTDEDEDLEGGIPKFPATPEKLRNLSMEQIGKLNEEDSLALAIRYSLKEAGNMSEDDQMRAAVDQSMSSPKGGGKSEVEDDQKEEVLDELSDLDGRRDNRISYQLASIVSHLGSSASSGHYIADVFRFDRKAWFRYNDMNVFKRSVDCVRSDENMRNGYLFVYTHCQLLPDS